MTSEITETRTEWPDTFFRRFAERFPFLTEGTIKVEEFKDADQMVVRAELPGIDPDKDVELTVQNGYLTLHAERREETKDESREHYRSEFRYGSFTRVVPLPAGATEDDVKATYSDGILDVRVPLDSAKTESRKIAISRS